MISDPQPESFGVGIVNNRFPVVDPHPTSILDLRVGQDERRVSVLPFRRGLPTQTR